MPRKPKIPDVPGFCIGSIVTAKPNNESPQIQAYPRIVERTSFISLHSDDQVLHNINRGEPCILLAYVKPDPNGVGVAGAVCFIASFDFRRMGWVRADHIQEM